MAKDVDAVIEALKIALDEARRSNNLYWKTRNANRWIGCLPGAWTGRWRNLKIMGNIDGEVYRDLFIGHVRATIAYLETNRDAIQAAPLWRWRTSAPKSRAPAEPIDADFADVPPGDAGKGGKRPKPLRVLK